MGGTDTRQKSQRWDLNPGQLCQELLAYEALTPLLCTCCPNYSLNTISLFVFVQILKNLFQIIHELLTFNSLTSLERTQVTGQWGTNANVSQKLNSHIWPLTFPLLSLMFWFSSLDVQAVSKTSLSLLFFFQGKT